jgi:predicted RND superfamily exporter protein
MAFNLKPVFDVKDFFSSNSSYVIGLDKLDKHYGSRAGEPGVIYLKGDLTNPDSLIAIKKFEKSLENDDSVSKDSNGRSTVEPNILDFLKLIVNNPYIKNEILNIYNIEITDLDSNEIPDTKKQIHTILEYINKNGIPLNDSTLIFNSDRIKENVYYDPNINSEVVTFLIIRIPGSREQSSIDKAYESITSKLNSLDDSGYFTEIGLTGSPFTRKAQLDASTDTLRTSLPIAVTATFILLLITMKSFRYAFATIIPIILVVTWLYGLMYLLGFSLNFVTAMIGAISIGIGIDYSIHITERFRQELKSSNSKNIAIEKSITGTGLAVVASALSSIVGFIILGFAPMPLFSSYGLLTALMMFLSIIASLVVLPCLLFFITPPKK